MRITAAQLVPVEVLPEGVAVALAAIPIEVDGHTTEDGGYVVPLVVPGLAELELELGLEGLFRLRLAGISGGELRVGALVEVRPLGTAELDLPPLLRPLTVVGDQWIDEDRVDPVTVALSGALGFDGQGRMHALVEPFDVAPFEVGRTGLRMELASCGLALSSGDLPEEHRPPGAAADFVGLYAAGARLRWLEPLSLGGLPGLRLDLERILVGSTGVTCDVTQTFAVTTSGATIAGGDLVGRLFADHLAVAVQTVGGSIVENVPTALRATGLVQIAPLDLLLGASFGLERRDDGRWATTFAASRQTGGVLPVGPGELTIGELELAGELDEEGFELSGSVSGSLAVGPVQVVLAEASASWSHAEELDGLELALGGLELGPLGTVELARLRLALQTEHETGETHVAVELEGEVAWDGLADRLELPLDLPSPPDEGRIGVRVHWEEKSPGEWDWVVRLALRLEDPDALWPFVPAALRPEARDFELVGELRWDAAAATDTAGEDVLAASFHGELSVRLPELPPFPGDDLLVLDAGDDEGWLLARIELEGTTAGNGSGSFALELEDVVGLAVNLPGLPSSRPPFATELDRVALELGADGDDASGRIVLAGSFVVRPLSPADLGLPVPPDIAVHLEKLFAAAGPRDLVGTATAELAFEGDAVSLTLTGEFGEGAGLEVDLFDVFAGLTRGMSGPDTEADASAIDLDLELGVALRRMRLSIGTDDDGEGTSVSLAATLELSVMGQTSELTLAFSEEELSLEASEVSIPIGIPELPLTLADLVALEGPDGTWALENAWTQGGEAAAAAAIEARAEELSERMARAEEIEAELAGPGDLGEERAALEEELRLIRDVEVPELQQENLHAAARKFLLDAIQAIGALLSADSNRATFQAFVTGYQAVLDNTLGHLGIDTGINFTISGARFLIPFDDPSNMRVEGGARLSGADPDGPLGFLGLIGFKLGLSAETVFFAVEGGADPIPLPDFGRYEGASFDIDHLYVGYGWNKNSLVVSFAGGLNLPEALVEDVDTSDLIGAGVRLPRTSRVGFKLDLIPVVLGEVDFVIPLFEFDLDLRTAGVPAIAGSAGCKPAWDGLELVVPGILRADYKRARSSIFFGFVPASNSVSSYDLQVGNDEHGVTHVCANYLAIGPIAGVLYVPTIFDASPFFDHLCTSVRLAGFELSFDLQRPFPSVHPMALLELMGFLSDPSMPIDPDGPLAGTVRATLADAKLVLPPAVAGMFGERGRTLELEATHTVNLATVIALGQGVQHVLERAVDATRAGAEDLAALVDDLAASPPDLSPEAVLRLLPPELRRATLHGAFVGFDATATLLLLTPEELAAELDRRGTPGLTPGSGLVFEADFRGEGELDRHWRQVDPGRSRGRWRRRGGTLEQSASAGEKEEPRRGTLLVLARRRFDELVLETAMRSRDDGGVGVVFGWVDADTHLRFRMGKQSKRWALERVAGGRAVELFGARGAYEEGRRYAVAIQVARVLPVDPVAPVGAGGFGEALPGRLPHGSRDLPERGTKVRIEVWVDSERWCSVELPSEDYRPGTVGFDSHWNAGTTYEHLRVYVEDPAGLAPGARASDGLARLALQRPNLLGGEQVFAPGDPTVSLLDGVEPFGSPGSFDSFGHDDLAALGSTGSTAPAVCVAARVRVLEEQRFAFVGLLQSDGRFALVSRLGLEPLVLRVLGLEVPLPLELDARLRLAGQSAGADSWSRVEAAGHAAWEPLPGLVSLALASPERPAALALASDGSFRLAGAVHAELFGGAAVLDGRLEVTQAHLLVSGTLAVAVSAGSTELFELRLDVDEGRIGPGPHFALSGGGSLSILGRPLADVEGRLDESGGRVRARLGLPQGETWSVAGVAVERAELELAGDLRLGGAAPELALRGEGVLGALGAELAGQGGFVSRDGFHELWGEGSLRWQGREWLSGFLRLGSEGLALGGTTRFALDLTTDDLPAPLGTKLAGLYFEAEVSGSFELTPTSGLAGCTLQVVWALGARLPGAAGQVVPIASATLEIDAPPAGGAGSLAKLLRVERLDLLPLPDVTIPVPTLDFAGGTTLYLSSVAVGGGSDTVSVPTLTTTKPSGDPDPLFKVPTGMKTPQDGWLIDPWGWVNILENLEYTKFYVGSTTRTVTIPSVNVPTVGLSEPDGASIPIPLPKPGVTLEEPVKAVLEGLDFDLHLVWRNGELGLQVGSSASGFTSFAQMFATVGGAPGSGYLIPQRFVNRIAGGRRVRG